MRTARMRILGQFVVTVDANGEYRESERRPVCLETDRNRSDEQRLPFHDNKAESGCSLMLQRRVRSGSSVSVSTEW